MLVRHFLAINEMSLKAYTSNRARIEQNVFFRVEENILFIVDQHVEKKCCLFNFQPLFFFLSDIANVQYLNHVDLKHTFIHSRIDSGLSILDQLPHC